MGFNDRRILYAVLAVIVVLVIIVGYGDPTATPQISGYR
jgi:hypothetical protein